MNKDSDTQSDPIRVEVVYGTREQQKLVCLELPAGSTVADAIEASGMESVFPEMQIDPRQIGIFSTKVSPDRALKAGDRVEIYRPLVADPKEVRRAMALAQKQEKDGAG